MTGDKIHTIKRKRNPCVCKKNELGKFIRWEKGEDQNEIRNKGDAAPDTVTEALIAAIFPGARKTGEIGMKTVRKFLEEKNFF